VNSKGKIWTAGRPWSEATVVGIPKLETQAGNKAEVYTLDSAAVSPIRSASAKGVCKQVWRVALGCWQGTNNINVNILSRRASSARNTCIGALTWRQILLYMLCSSTKLCDALISWWDSLPGICSWIAAPRSSLLFWVPARACRSIWDCSRTWTLHERPSVKRLVWSFDVVDVCREFGNKARCRVCQGKCWSSLDWSAKVIGLWSVLSWKRWPSIKYWK